MARNQQRRMRLCPKIPKRSSPIWMKPPEDVTARFWIHLRQKFLPVHRLPHRRTAFIRPESDLPPCILCDEVSIQRKTSPSQSLSDAADCLYWLDGDDRSVHQFPGLFGLPIIITGLYLFSRIDDVWVCQNCGAVGKKCGQPSR